MENENNYFDTRYSFNPSRHKVWRAIAEYIQKYIPYDASVLELGSGYCDFINQIHAQRRVALDYNEISKQYANIDVNFVQSSILDFSPNEKFDIVFASNFLEHFSIQELEKVMSVIYNSLHDSGKLILIQPNYFYCYRNYWDDYTHKTVFSHNNIHDFLLANHFDVKLIRSKFLPFSFKSHLPTSYFLTKLYLYSPYKPFAKQMLIVAEKCITGK